MPRLTCHPDGKRRRRHFGTSAKRAWYARHRAARFARRFGFRRATSKWN